MMFFLKKNIFSIVFLSLIFQMNLGCGKKDSNKNGSGTAPSTGEIVDNTPVGQVDISGFWVNVASTEYMTLTNKKDAYGAKCFIDVDATEGQQMDCIVDMLEGDLYSYNVQIQYNVPPELCDHVRVTPAWHWNQSVGEGPTDVVVNVDTSGDPVVTSCTARNAAGAVIACGSLAELTNITNPEGPTCVYDLSVSERPNCCFGFYTKTIVSDDGTNPATTTVTPGENWGGDVASCVGGLGQSWPETNQAGYPVSILVSVPKGDQSNEEGDSSDDSSSGGATSGLNSAIVLSSNSSGPRAGFSTFANFFETSGAPSNHDGYVLAVASDLPYAVAPIDDLDGSSVVSGSEAYVVTCLDAAFEVKYQIRTYIREWNTVADLVAYKASGGVTYNPNVTGVEGVGCDHSGTFGGPCNDLGDFGDLLFNAGGTYDTTPGVGAAATRASYFPNVQYQ